MLRRSYYYTANVGCVFSWTGGTGFVGQYVLTALLAAGHTVTCLVRKGAKPSVSGVNYVRGDLALAGSLDGMMAGCDAVMHLVGIIEEDPRRNVTFESAHVNATDQVVAAAKHAGVRRCVFVSANGARADGVTRYQTTKWQAEQLVQQAGFEHATILRPSLVFGDPGQGRDDFCTRLVRDLIRPFPVLPVFGSGSYCMQPVDVEAVAAACIQALKLDGSRTYPVAGQERIAFVEILDRLCIACGIAPKRKVHVPLVVIRPAVRALGGTRLLPVTSDQLAMLVEGNTCDEASFYRDFDVTPKPFYPQHLTYVRGGTP